MSHIKLFFFLLIIPHLVFGDTNCDNELSLSLNQKSVDFSTNSSQRLDFLVYRDNSKKSCKYFVTFGKGSSSNYNRKLFLAYPTSSLPFQIYNDVSTPSVLMDFPEVNSENNIISGSFLNSQTSAPGQHTYLANLGSVPLGSNVGYYSDTIIVTLYSGEFSSSHHHREGSQTITFSYYVPPSMSLSLVDTGAPYNEYSTDRSIDFGVMTSGQTQNFDTIIKSNSGYKLFFTSENGGKMSHNSLPAYVPYSVQINGTTVNLVQNTAIQVASGYGVTPTDGQRLNVKLTLGTINTQPAGNYVDFITVTVQSN